MPDNMYTVKRDKDGKATGTGDQIRVVPGTRTTPKPTQPDNTKKSRFSQHTRMKLGNYGSLSPYDDAIDKQVDKYVKDRKVPVRKIKEEKKMTKAQIKKRDEIADAISTREMNKRYGDKNVKYAIATKLAMKEEENDKYNVSEEGLRDWFGKSSGTTKSGRKVRGWVQVGGKYDGKPCARQPGQKSTPKCVSSSKRRSMSKSERDSAARRKRAADPNQPQKSGAAKPTNVSTDPKKKMSENYFNRNKSIDEMAGIKKIVKGGRSVRSLGAKRPEGTLLSRQKAKLSAETGKKLTKPPYSAGQTPTEVRTRADSSNTYAYRPSDADNPRDFAIAKKPETTITQTSDADKAARRARVKEMERQGKVRKTSYESKQHIDEAKDKKGKGSGTKDACYHKVKSRYSVWPSAYASGALVKCRKVGAANWGNKSKNEGFSPMQVAALETAGMIEIKEGQKCWKGYEKKGTKMMFGKRYNNCVKKKTTKEEVEQLDELSKETLRSYGKEALKDKKSLEKKRRALGNYPAITKKIEKRNKGIDLAIKKLSKEEVEHIDEKMINVTPNAIRKRAAKSIIKKDLPKVAAGAGALAAGVAVGNKMTSTNEGVEFLKREKEKKKI